MKLLLTSGGITNRVLADSLKELIGKEFKDSKLVFIPTAAYAELGDKSWLIEDLLNLRNLGFKSIDIVDVASSDIEKWKSAVFDSDVIFVGGGNTFYLMYWMEKSGFKDILVNLLKDKVYAGISAGSCVAGPKVLSKIQDFFPEEVNEFGVSEGLNIVDFLVLPHLNSKHFPLIRENNVKEKFKEENYDTYVLDDNCAIMVNNSKIEIVGTGESFIIKK